MEEPLHVGLINDSFPPQIDGVANAVLNYARILQKQNNYALVAAPYNPDADDSVYPFRVIRYQSIDVSDWVGYRAGNPLDPKAIDQISQEPLNIIHAHCPVTAVMLGRSIRETIKVPMVFTYHTKFDIDIRNAISAKLLQEAAIKALVRNIESCDDVWVVSKGAGDNLRSLGYNGSYTVMENGVDVPKGRASDSMIQTVMDLYHLDLSAPLFLYVGRMMWYKGIRITLDALKRLLEAEIDFRMAFVGGGTDKDEIVAYSQKLGLDGKVFFIPPIHDRHQIRAWYCRADLFLFPSTFDTNGLVVREAAACGLGSVLVKGSCAAEEVTGDRNGLLIEENAESMATALAAVCSSRERMKEIGEAAQEELYISWDSAVKNAVERYAVVIDNYKTGQYPVHEKPQDEMLRGIGELMSVIGTSEIRRKEIRDYLAGVLEGKHSGAEWMHPFDAGVTDAVFRSMSNGLKDWKREMENGFAASRAEGKRRSNELKESIEEGLQEFYDISL